LSFLYTQPNHYREHELLPSDTDLLTPEEAAVYLRLNPQTTYRLLRSQQLPGVKIGRQWRIRKTILDAFIDGRLPELQVASHPKA
jgi:excisionase family DNA binding protein